MFSTLNDTLDGQPHEVKGAKVLLYIRNAKSEGHKQEQLNI